MQLIRNPRRPVPCLPDGCVATVGAFDGLHLGHQRILACIIDEARERGLPALVFSFEPMPKEYFSRGSPPARLMRFREKFAALAAAGIDIFYCPRFESRMEGLEPDAFVDDILVGLLGVRHLVVGDDFRFARARRGTIAELRAAGKRRGFTVEQVASVQLDGERVSSSAVRAALAAGDLDRATAMLGRRYRMTGKVIAGRGLGRELGMPTANVRLNRTQTPVEGIFAVRVGNLGEGAWLDGVASIGTRPTVDGTEPLLEVHVFDFDRDIYGAQIQVEFVARLRDEVRFPDLESLTEQMFRDADAARSILRNTTDSS